MKLWHPYNDEAMGILFKRQSTILGTVCITGYLWMNLKDMEAVIRPGT